MKKIIEKRSCNEEVVCYILRKTHFLTSYKENPIQIRTPKELAKLQEEKTLWRNI